MKRFFFLAAVAAATFFAACTKPDTPVPDPNSGTETKDEVSVSPANVAFEGDGGTVRVAVTTNVTDYTVSGNPQWLKVEKNGKEITLTAEANTVAEARNCSLSITAGKASCSLAVTQKAGSPYPGFIVSTAVTFEYAGTMLYQFLKPQEEDFGGQGYIVMEDEDGNTLSLWVYTELFESEDQVEISAGTYEKGNDNYPYTLVAKKYTYAPGVTFSFSDEGDDEGANVGGSYYFDMATGEEILLTDGTITVTSNGDGTQVILVDMLTPDGTPVKYVFMGEPEIDTESATYPNPGRIDVAATVFGAAGYYMGDVYGNGTSVFQIEIYSGDEDDPAITTYEFITEGVEFSEDIDLSGEYYTPAEPEEGEDPVDPLAPGTLIPGVLEELFPGFEFPSGTYIMYSFGDYLIADGFGSLVLEKQEDGKYTFTSALMSTDNDMVMFMGADFTGIHDLEIPIIDASESGEDD